MSWRTTGILFVILLLLAGVAYWQSQESEEADVESEVPSPAANTNVNPFEGVTVESVRRLEVEQGSDGANASFRRETDGSWFMTVPTATQVMSTTLTNNIRSLVSTGSRRTIPADENPLDVYGLNEVDNHITLAVQRENQVLQYRLDVGNATPADDAYYVLKQGDPRVYIVSKSLLDNIFALAEAPPLPEPALTSPPTAPITGTETITSTQPISPTIGPDP